MLVVWGNWLEGWFWLAVAAAVWIGGRHDPRIRRARDVAVVAFVLFGVSDFVETRTGAWWRPWWLLLWKAGCVAALLWALREYRAVRAR